MQENRADIIFHPIRIRIVQSLFGNRMLTAQQMVEILGGPSIATLYRQLNRLVQSGIISVVEERAVRGATEKVYALAHGQAAIFTEEERRQIRPEDRMRHFTTLIGTLLNDFGSYLDQEDPKRKEAEVIVRQDALYLTAREAAQLGRRLQETLAPYVQDAPDVSRHRHLLTTILLPIIEPINAPENTD